MQTKLLNICVYVCVNTSMQTYTEYVCTFMHKHACIWVNMHIIIRTVHRTDKQIYIYLYLNYFSYQSFAFYIYFSMLAWVWSVYLIAALLYNRLTFFSLTLSCLSKMEVLISLTFKSKRKLTVCWDGVNKRQDCI